MIIATAHSVGRWNIGVLAGSHVAIVELAAFVRRMRGTHLIPQTVFVVDTRQWIAEAECVRLITLSGRRDSARLLAELACVVEAVRKLAVAQIEALAHETVQKAIAVMDESTAARLQLEALIKNYRAEPETAEDAAGLVVVLEVEDCLEAEAVEAQADRIWN